MSMESPVTFCLPRKHFWGFTGKNNLTTEEDGDLFLNLKKNKKATITKHKAAQNSSSGIVQVYRLLGSKISLKRHHLPFWFSSYSDD